MSDSALRQLDSIMLGLQPIKINQIDTTIVSNCTPHNNVDGNTIEYYKALNQRLSKKAKHSNTVDNNDEIVLSDIDVSDSDSDNELSLVEQYALNTVPCSVCHHYNIKNNKLVQCNICHVTVHQKCYLIDDADEQYSTAVRDIGTFICQPCYSNNNTQRTDIEYCDICGTYNDKALLQYDEQWLHPLCAQLVPEINDGCTACDYCKIDIGICVKCDYSEKCWSSVHVPCAIRQHACDVIKHGSKQFYLFYCNKHMAKINRSKNALNNRLLQIKYKYDEKKLDWYRSVSNYVELPVIPLKGMQYLIQDTVKTDGAGQPCRHTCCKLTCDDYAKLLVNRRFHESQRKLHVLCDASCTGYKLLSDTQTSVRYIKSADIVIPIKRVDDVVTYSCRHTCHCNKPFEITYDLMQQCVINTTVSSIQVNKETLRSKYVDMLTNHESCTTCHTNCTVECQAYQLTAEYNVKQAIQTKAQQNKLVPCTTCHKIPLDQYYYPQHTLLPTITSDTIHTYVCRHTQCCTEPLSIERNKLSTDSIHSISSIRQRMLRHHERNAKIHKQCNYKCSGYQLLHSDMTRGQIPKTVTTTIQTVTHLV